MYESQGTNVLNEAEVIAAIRVTDSLGNCFQRAKEEYLRDIENDVPTPKVIDCIEAKTIGSFQLRVRPSSEQKQAGTGESN